MVANQKHHLYIKNFIRIWNTTYIHISLQMETRKNSLHRYKKKSLEREGERGRKRDAYDNEENALSLCSENHVHRCGLVENNLKVGMVAKQYSRWHQGSQVKS